MNTTDLIDTWSTAERSGDVAELNRLLHNDFRGVGPLGFVLTKDQWVHRYDGGGLVNETFTVSETSTREFGDTTVVTGVQEQRTFFHDKPSHGRFRVTVVVAGGAIAHVQLSLIEWM